MTPILVVDDLHKHFPVRNVWGVRTAWARALDGVSFQVTPGEVLGVVGESGCGKSTLGKTIAGIHSATAGRVEFDGHRIDGLSPSTGRRMRRALQYCYQDPGASLDPHWKIGSSLLEPLIVHEDMTAADRRARVDEVLRAVGLPEAHLKLYPHEISGGQQRRVGLARILALRPGLVILDEPTSGLDVSVQANVLGLLADLRSRFDLTYLFISHDLSVVRLFSQRIAVMYLGRVVELGLTRAVFETPRHPYTRSLLAAVPMIGGRRVTETMWLDGEPPSLAAVPSGCRFRTRCSWAADICAREDPALRTMDDGCQVACHFAERTGAPAHNHDARSEDQ
jgi:oligopeptide/dipeptide ABC transporter ATP-binding protein